MRPPARPVWGLGTGILLTLLTLIHPRPVKGQVTTEKGYECTRRCTVDDPTATCWRQSLGFYTDQLTSAVQEYAAIITHIARWNNRAHGRSSFKAMARTMVATIVATAEKKKTLEPLPADDLMAIFELILNKTAALEEHYNDPEVIPVTHMCPIPCDYYPRIWMNLFFVTLTSLLLMSIALCLYLTQQQLRMERRLKHR